MGGVITWLKIVKIPHIPGIVPVRRKLNSRLRIITKISIFVPDYAVNLTMFSKRFFISWIASTIVMFLLSYVWHGLFLTDFKRLSYPVGIYLIFAAIVYMIIGFVVAKAIDFKGFEKNFKRRPIMRGVISGAACGIAFFLVATVVGVSFSTGNALENLILDISWQFFEQMMGGLTAGIVHILVFDPAVMQED
jgi:H+/Cl- antiporter ClcA